MNPRYPLVATGHLAAQAKSVIWPVLDPYQGQAHQPAPIFIPDYRRFAHIYRINQRNLSRFYRLKAIPYRNPCQKRKGIYHNSILNKSLHRILQFRGLRHLRYSVFS